MDEKLKNRIDQYEKSQPILAAKYQNHTLKFIASNSILLFRIDTLLSKEPCTIEWLNTFDPDEIFFDIGANIGIYTIFAAIVRGAKVFAFEPESQNYAALNQNIAINQLQDKVIAYCLALTEKINIDKLYLSNFQLGSSCHSFGEKVGFDLHERESPFAQGCVSWTLDKLIEDKVLPIPDHIKIDVDGYEHKVIAGAKSLLADPHLKSVQIELNPHLPEHQILFTTMREHGFDYSDAQFRRAQRTSGTFKDVGEVDFYRVNDTKLDQRKYTIKEVLNHTNAQINNSTLNMAPFPHLLINDLIPKDYYEELLKNIPTDLSLYANIDETGRATGYKERFIIDLLPSNINKLPVKLRLFWQDLDAWLLSENFMHYLYEKLKPHLHLRNVKLPENPKLSPQALLVRDFSNYQIGPHTDHPRRLISMLLYVPKDEEFIELGTSMYTPKDENFRSTGTQHHNNPDFNIIKTFDFKPNTAFIFLKTDNSFHGVEQIKRKNIQRDLIVYYINIDNYED